jgi:hypothetical protein
MGNELTFVTVIESGSLEIAALWLVESLRRWGGRYADSPFLFVKPRAGPGPGYTTRRRMHKLGVDYRVTPSEKEYEWYDFLNKPVALQAAGAVAKTPMICWLDADILVLGEPSLLDPGPDNDLAICAPDVNIGTYGPGSRYEAYWATYCNAVGFPLEDLGWVRPCGKESVIRSYFNGGVMSIRTSSGLVEEYYKTVIAALAARLASSTDGIFMHEQMAIGIATRRLGLRVRQLPINYNYSCYELNSPSSPESRVSKLTLLHYHGAFWPATYDDTLRRIAERCPERLDFVRSLGTIKMSRINPMTRLRVRLLRRGRQRRQEKYMATCQTIETPPLTYSVQTSP